MTVTFLHFVACSTPQRRQPWHQPMHYCVWTQALTCVGKCMKILAPHDEMDYRLSWRLTRLSQTHVMYHWKWWTCDGRLYWEETVFISDSNLSWVLFILFCTTKSELPRRRAGDRYKQLNWIYWSIQTNTSNKNAVCTLCYVHYNVIQSILMAVVKEMQSLHKRESMCGRERPLLYKQWIP